MATQTADCNCFAVRSAARHVTQLYDQFLAPAGLRGNAVLDPGESLTGWAR